MQLIQERIEKNIHNIVSRRNECIDFCYKKIEKLEKRFFKINAGVTSLAAIGSYFHFKDSPGWEFVAPVAFNALLGGLSSTMGQCGINSVITYLTLSKKVVFVEKELQELIDNYSILKKDIFNRILLKESINQKDIAHMIEGQLFSLRDYLPPRDTAAFEKINQLVEEAIHKGSEIIKGLNVESVIYPHFNQNNELLNNIGSLMLREAVFPITSTDYKLTCKNFDELEQVFIATEQTKKFAEYVKTLSVSFSLMRMQKYDYCTQARNKKINYFLRRLIEIKDFDKNELSKLLNIYKKYNNAQDYEQLVVLCANSKNADVLSLSTNSLGSEDIPVTFEMLLRDIKLDIDQPQLMKSINFINENIEKLSSQQLVEFETIKSNFSSTYPKILKQLLSFNDKEKQKTGQLDIIASIRNNQTQLTLLEEFIEQSISKETRILKKLSLSK